MYCENEKLHLQLKKEKKKLFQQLLEEVEEISSFDEMQQYIQHGRTSCLLHSVAVAYYSYYFASLFHIDVDETSLIRGALLHDYYLYDWHVKEASHKWHGFRHPKTSLSNARNVFQLSKVEEDLIAHHMFPLTPIPPHSKEAVIVCLVDKICSIYELRRMRRYEHLYYFLCGARKTQKLLAFTGEQSVAI